MNALSLVKVAVALTVKVPNEALERHLACSPPVVGAELADQVQAYERSHRLGYYPALEFFRENGGVEDNLLDAADHIAWMSANLVREEVRSKLRPVFSSVSFQAIQPLAFTLPAVRPGELNARHRLTEHYTPDTIKLTLLVSSFLKRQDPEALQRWARHLLWRWLKPSFAAMEVTSAKVV